MSDMDTFIQRNFFSGENQLAMCMDPLGGSLAVFANIQGSQQYLPRIWVDAREYACWVPASAAAEKPTSAAQAPDSTAAELRALESRVAQLVAAMDEQKATVHRFTFVATVVFCLAVVVTAAYSIFSQMRSRVEPPQLMSFAPVPVAVGSRTVLLGIGVMEWRVPSEVNAMIVEQAKQEAEAKLRLEAAKGSPSAARSASPPAHSD